MVVFSAVGSVQAQTFRERQEGQIPAPLSTAHPRPLWQVLGSTSPECSRLPARADRTFWEGWGETLQCPTRLLVTLSLFSLRPMRPPPPGCPPIPGDAGSWLLATPPRLTPAILLGDFEVHRGCPYGTLALTLDLLLSLACRSSVLPFVKTPSTNTSNPFGSLAKTQAPGLEPWLDPGISFPSPLCRPGLPGVTSTQRAIGTWPLPLPRSGCLSLLPS